MNHKLITLIIIFIILNLVTIHSQINPQIEKRLIKRTIAILPFHNENEIEKYDYLNSDIFDNLIHKIDQNFSIIPEKVIKKIINEKSLYNFNEQNIELIAMNVNADIIVFGSYLLTDNEMSINSQMVNVITGEIILKYNYKDTTKLDTNFIINNFSINLSELINEKLSLYDTKLVDIIINKDKLEPEKKKLLDNLLNQTNTFWNIIVNRANYKQYVPVPFGLSSYIFICEQTDEFIIEFDKKKYDYKSNVKVISLDNSINAIKNFKIYFPKDTEPTQYTVIQKKALEVNVKYLEFSYKKEIDNYNFFIENGLNISTANYIGYDFKIGMGFPMNSKLNNNLYLRFFIGPKALNIAQIDKNYVFLSPHLKFKIGIGYEHIFYIHNFFGIQTGIDFGIEFNYYSFLIKNFIKVDLPYMILGNPSLCFSFPVALQIFSNRNICLIIGFEPVLRFVINSFYYRNILWVQALDETRGIGFSSLRQQIDTYLTLDLFFYDMPVIIAARIKF